MSATNQPPASDASRQHDERLRMMIESVPDYGIFMLDLDGRVVSWNLGAERLTGYEANEILGRHLSVFVTEEDRRHGHPQQELDAARERGSFAGEAWRLRKDGSRFWASSVITLLKDEQGVPYGFGKVTRDLTERRRAEEDARRLADARIARENAEKLQRATAAFALAMTSQDVARTVLESVLPVLGADSGSLAVRIPGTDQFKVLWRYGYPDARRRDTFSLSEALPHSDAARLRAPIFLESADDIEAAYPNIAKANGLVALASLPLVVRDECIGVMGFSYKVARRMGPTEHHLGLAFADHCALALDRAMLFERELEAKRRAEFLSDAGPVLSGSLDQERVLAELARLAVPRLGDWCSVEVPDGDGIRQVAVSHIDPSKVELAREYRRKYPPAKRPGTGLYHVVTSGKAELYAEITDAALVASARDEEELRIARSLGIRSGLCVPIVAHGRVLGALTLVWAETDRRYTSADVEFVQDLCGRAGLAVENARLYQDVRRAVEVREEFLSVAGHELRTPLAALSLHLQTVLRTIRREPGLAAFPRLATALEKALGNYGRLAKLVEELLDVTRLSSRGIELEPEPLELTGLVEAVLGRFTDEAANAKSPLRWRAGPRLSGSWDRLRIEQVASNLISNAIKYGEGKPVEVETSQEEGFAVLRVKDHGIGISPDAQQRIFGRFERAVSGAQYGGLGLGLWIARQAVEASGGSVEVHSAPGEGSEFTVRLPLTAAR